MLEKIKGWASKFFTHQSFRDIAITLNYFCLVELVIIVFFSWQIFDLLQWYKSIMTVENFNSTAFWGAITASGVSVLGALRSIYQTGKDK